MSLYEDGLSTLTEYLRGLYPNQAIEVTPDPDRAGVWLLRAEREPFLLAVTMSFFRDNAPEPGILYWLDQWFIPDSLAQCTDAEMVTLDEHGPGLIRRV